MSDAASRGWGPGWPNCQTGTIVTLKRADGLRLPVRRELAPLIAWLIDETERRGYDVRPDWTWGYACRAIRGSSRPSNHSWGLAVDINAPKNPMGPKLITDMPAWMVDLWQAHGFRWGGSYQTRPDAMHYEFMGTPADAARYTAQILAPPPPPPAPTLEVSDMALAYRFPDGNVWLCTGTHRQHVNGTTLQERAVLGLVAEVPASAPNRDAKYPQWVRTTNETGVRVLSRLKVV